jgi:hypothetical protein
MLQLIWIFGGSGPAMTAHGSLDLKQEIQIQIQIQIWILMLFCQMLHHLDGFFVRKKKNFHSCHG